MLVLIINTQYFGSVDLCLIITGSSCILTYRDAFLAAFIYHLLKNPKSLSSITQEDMRAVLRFASAAGALTCTRKGAIAAQPSIDDIVTLLDNDSNNNINNK